MKRLFPIILSISLALAAAISPSAQPGVSADPASTPSTQIDLVGPPGSGEFGKSVTALPNGNIIVTDPYYDLGSTVDVGAVYLYAGGSGALISTLTGSMADDRVGYDGVVVLSNGSYVVRSLSWDNGGATDTGAVTWCSGTIGCTGTVSAANSLVGSTASDQVGYYVTALNNGNYVVGSPNWGGATKVGAVTWGSGTNGITGTISSANSLMGSIDGDRVGSGGIVALSNGNYVVRTTGWDNSGATNAGAVTWGNGTTGITGTVSSTNSLVGSAASDNVGSNVMALSNGNYVVGSQYWDNGGAAEAGAVTWGNGTTGITGTISSANSLVGSRANDYVSYPGVVVLSDGNYVVRSREWDNGEASNVGAATWGNGTTGTSGVVSSTNSLVGSTANDRVGSNVVELSNGNYVVSSPNWDNGTVADVGAVTWCNSTASCTGAISSTNSLVGFTAGDWVGSDGVVALSNGNYVVRSLRWSNNGMTNAGAVTWGNGTMGTTGVISSANSLMGSTADDQVGSDGVVALSNGNYVVSGRFWDNGGVTDAGAATWCSGTTGCTGVVTATNSLVGSTTDDWVGRGVVALSNGNYVVRSPYWDDGAVTDVGAVTWGDGTMGVSGSISSTNSLVGSTADDYVGLGGVIPLDNGNYVVNSRYWDDVGAVTWGDGMLGISGPVSTVNSLVGSTAGDQVGHGGVTPLGDGNYVVLSPDWDNGGAADAGAVTWGWGAGGARGPITSESSVLGTATNGGSSLVFAHDPINLQLVVGRPADNIVNLFRPYMRVFMPLVLR
jgi:hypothetical protein